MRETTVHGAIVAAALANSDRVAFCYFRDGWRSLSYGGFLVLADAFRRAFLHMGLAAGDRVALIAENRPEWPAAYVGALMAGAQMVPVDQRMTAGELGNILGDSGAKFIVHTGQTGPTAHEAARGPHVKFIDLDSVTFPEVQSEDFRQAVPGDVAALLYTSGTTGSPKAVMLTHQNFLSDAGAVLRAGIITSRDNMLCVLPLHHTYPFMCAFLVPLLAGAAVTFAQGIGGPEIVSASRQNRVTVVIGVPQMYELMYRGMLGKLRAIPVVGRLSGPVVRLSGLIGRLTGINPIGLFLKPLGRDLRFLACGGARLDPEVMTGLEALGFRVLEGYGLTETSPIVAFNPLGRRKPGSVGKPLSPAEIRIVSVPGTKEGEVAVRGPMVMAGYYGRPEETGAAIRDGWLMTGDLGYLDGEGYLFLTGRLKEVIVLGSGKNVYPEEVEKHYLSCPLISEICVMEDGGRLVAVIVPDLDQAKKEKVGNMNEALRWEINALSEGLPRHMRLRGFDLRSEPLPRTPLGKIRRFMVKAGGRGGDIGGPAADRVFMDPAGAAVLRALDHVRPPGPPVRAGDNLELDLGLDSLMRVELATRLEHELAREIPDELLSEVHTVDELVRAVGGIAEGPGTEAKDEEGEGLPGYLYEDPSDDEKRSIGLGQGPVARGLAFVLRAGLRIAARVLFGLRVTGADNIPETPCIIAPNHASYLDGFVMALGLPYGVFRTLYFLGVRKYFSGRLASAFGRLAHVIPIDPDAHLGNALRLSSYVLRNGGSVVIFPEGGRSFDGGLMEFKKGVGVLAVALGVPVVPAKIEGTFGILPRGAALPRPGRIEVRLGSPVVPPAGSGAQGPSSSVEGEDIYQRLADELRKRVMSL